MTPVGGGGRINYSVHHSCKRPDILGYICVYLIMRCHRGTVWPAENMGIVNSVCGQSIHRE